MHEGEAARGRLPDGVGLRCVEVLALEDDLPGHEVDVIGEVLVPVFERGLELVPVDVEWLMLHATRNVTPSP